MSKFNLLLLNFLIGALLQKSYAIKLSLSNLDEQQRNILKEFRANVERELPHDYMKSDHYLLRFLHKNDYSIPDATNNLRQHLEWRQAENVDRVLHEDWSDMEEKFPYDLFARDRNGNPIIYLPIGMYNLREVIESGKLDRMKRYFTVKLPEDAAALLRNLNANGQNGIVQYELIYDMEGNSPVYDIACVECLFARRDMRTTAKFHYPLAADNAFLVNASSLLQYTFPFLADSGSELTMHVLGSHDSYEPVLLNYMEKDQFPKNLK